MCYKGFEMLSYVYLRRTYNSFVKSSKILAFSPSDKTTKDFKLNKIFKTFKYVYGILSLLLFIFCGLLCFNFMSKIKKQNQLHYNKVVSINYEDAKAFDFLIESGRSRLKKGDVKAAYSEFILASKIKPNHLELHQLTAETLSVLCEKDKQFCKALDVLLGSNL